MKSFLSVFSSSKKIKKNKIIKKEYTTNIFNSLILCFQYLESFIPSISSNNNTATSPSSNFKTNTSLNCYSILKLNDNQINEINFIVTQISNETFQEQMIRKLFDPILISLVVKEIFQQFEPIFTYELSQELINESQNIQEIINKLSTTRKQFIKRFFHHLNLLIQGNLAKEVDIISCFNEILIEIHPNESVKDSIETLNCINLFNEIFTNWKLYFNFKDDKDILNSNNSISTNEKLIGIDSTIVTYSIQERSVKISFPKGDYEENYLDQSSLSKILGRFGEISEV